MGLFDKVKSLKNAITGGAAKVHIDVNAGSLHEPFSIVIKAQIEDKDVKVDRVYLEIQGREEIRVPDTDVIYDSDGDRERRTEVVRANNVTTELEITVAEAQVLEANKHYEWTASVQLPGDALPLYKGKYCQHSYRARASLDCFGNDPDSGWVELDIS